MTLGEFWELGDLRPQDQKARAPCHAAVIFFELLPEYYQSSDEK
jgi:hypothetical protein